MLRDANPPDSSMESRVDKALELFTFGKRYNCAQAIFSVYGEALGLDKETALKVACGFGGGMARLGGACGAVTGACMVIGLKYASALPVAQDPASREKTYATMQEFERRFVEKNGSTVCRELLEVDLLRGDKQVIAQRVQEVCPRVIKDAAEILETLLF